MKKYNTVLTIAGSDSGGGAGIQADIKAISACGCYAASAITALTVQNTVGVRAIHVPPSDIVVGQIEAVIDDMEIDAIKLGMLPTEEIINEVARIIETHHIERVVLDPVMVATSGDRLIPESAADALIGRLMPMVMVVTPNIPEAEYISGLKIQSEADFEQAAHKITSMGAKNVLLKSGHLANSELLTDYLFGADRATSHYEFDFIDTANTHGTGCTLSSAIAAYLAQGYELAEAVAHAEEYLHKAILAGADYHLGNGHGPVHHFFKFWDNDVIVR